MQFVLTLLNLLDNEALLALFAKVVRAKSVVTWPQEPGDAEQQAQLLQLYVTILGVGFDRGLVQELQQHADGVRAKLKAVAPNGILPSDLL